MPIEVKGLLDLRKNLNKFAPDLAKQMNKEIKEAAKPVVNQARGFLPASVPGLSNWSKSKNGSFPTYDGGSAKRGIKFLTSPTKRNRRGFVSLYRFQQNDAGGQIFELAGRVHSQGRPWKGPTGNKSESRSNNPKAGLHFIRSINSVSAFPSSSFRVGRALYKAYDKNEGKAKVAILKAIDSATKKLETR